MYTIKVYENPQMLQKIPRIKVYRDNSFVLVISYFVVASIVILIILNGLYPTPVMDLLERIGVVEYTEVTNASIRTFETRNSKGEYSTNYELVGKYLDKSNRLHYAYISLHFAHGSYLNEDYLTKNGDKCPIAYFSFYPDYNMLRIPSTFSLFIAYSCLLASLYYLFVLLYRRRKMRLLLLGFSIGKVLRPKSFTTLRYESKSHHYYSYYAIWECPDGERWETTPMKKEVDKFESLTFPDDYYGIYLKSNKGEELIIHHYSAVYIAKKYGYKINDGDITVPKASRRKLSHGDGRESNQNSRTHHKNDRNNRHSHERNK